MINIQKYINQTQFVICNGLVSNQLKSKIEWLLSYQVGPIEWKVMADNSTIWLCQAFNKQLLLGMENSSATICAQFYNQLKSKIEWLLSYQVGPVEWKVMADNSTIWLCQAFSKQLLLGMEYSSATTLCTILQSI